MSDEAYAEEFYGVEWDEEEGFWRATITVDGKVPYCEWAASAHDAAWIREMAIIHGPLAARVDIPRNFPECTPTEIEANAVWGFLLVRLLKMRREGRGATYACCAMVDEIAEASYMTREELFEAEFARWRAN